MPTSTATMTVSQTTTKVSKLPVSARKSTKNAIATLRSLYPRAARAFLQRDVALTHSLLLSAFSNLPPPLTSTPDPLSSHRRKWDILRITLETTLHSSGQAKFIPESLQTLLMLSPPTIIATMHTRSIQLYTPANRGRPTAEFLPSQILVTLALASVKLECVHVGREMVEDWLTRRSQTGYDSVKDEKQLAEELEGYEKVLEVYCLHILPRLDDWEYAQEFLRYENELPEDRRMYLVQSVQVIHSEHISTIEKERLRLQSVSPSSSRTPTPRPPTVVPASPARTPSPSPSMTSVSSTSTHTAVPIRRPNGHTSSLTSLTPTPRTQSPAQLHPPRISNVTQRHSRTTSPLPITLTAPSMPITSLSPPSLLTLFKTSFIPHLTKSKLSFLVIMCLVSVVSFVFRIRRKRLRLLHEAQASKLVSASGLNAAEKAKRRMGAGWWSGVQKAVLDTVKMAGSGLV